MPVLLAKRRRDDQLRHLLADDLVGPVPEDPLGGGVELEHAAPVVDGDDAVEGGVEDGGVPGFPFALARFEP